MGALMGVTERIWNALTAMIKLEDKVTRQSEAIKTQQMKIENLTERVIRLETALEIGLAQTRAQAQANVQPPPQPRPPKPVTQQRLPQKSNERIGKK
jgi:FtsZ-binding cell division protein ZapB